MTPHRAADRASTDIAPLLTALGPALDPLVRGERPAAGDGDWRALLDRPLPENGAAPEETLQLLVDPVARHGAPFLAPGFAGWIIGSPTAVPVAASLVTSVSGQQRYLGFSGNLIEAVALRWIAELCALPPEMQGVFSSGGSVANLIALGAARQRAYERLGIDPARDGLAGAPSGRIYASQEVHHSVLKAAGVLGMGRGTVRALPTDGAQRLDVRALRHAVRHDIARGHVPAAVVGIAGTTNTGAVDPLAEIAEVAAEHDVWFHVDGAYGLFGVLDPAVADLFAGLELADSVVVDMHKWLAVPTGSGATYVRDTGVLGRAFSQEPSDYIEGGLADEPTTAGSPWDSLGKPYHEWSLELSAAARGIPVWATLHELGRAGMRERVVHHRALARRLAERVRREPMLELLHDPVLSICCFRVRGPAAAGEAAGDAAGAAAGAAAGDAAGEAEKGADALTRQVLRRLHADGAHVPSGTYVDGRFALRACLINPRQSEADIDTLVDAVLAHARQLATA